MNKFFVAFILLRIFIASPNLAQTFPCDLNFKDGKGMNQTKLIGLYQDLLLVSDSTNYKIINVDKINNIKFNNGTYLWTGMAAGAGVGFITGMILYGKLTSKKRKILTNDATLDITLVFTLPAAVIGSIIGLFFKNIDNYDLSKRTPYEKYGDIKYIIREHNMWK